MDEDICTYEQFILAANACGVYDEIDTELYYKLYLAINDGDEKEIIRQINSIDYNQSCRLTNRFN